MRSGYCSGDIMPMLLGAVTVAITPLAVLAANPELQLADFESPSLVSSGLQQAGMNGDLRMIKLWARLKAGALETEGRQAADQVGDEKMLANARMRVRSVQPYLDEAQRDVFLGRWKFVQGYMGVVFSQRDAFQTVITNTYPGTDAVSLASKDALISEGNNVVQNAEALAAAAKAGSEPRALQAYAKLSLSYDRFLKAGDLYGNALLLPSGSRPKPPKAKPPPVAAPQVVATQQAAAEATARLGAAERAAERAADAVSAEAKAAKKAAALEASTAKVADKAEAASEKADAAAEKAATAEKQAVATAAAEKAEKTELEAEAAEAAAAKAAAERRSVLAAAEERLKLAEQKEAESASAVRLYEKALEYEVKQDAAARKLATQKDMTSSLVPQYDPLTSTESLYKDTPQSALQYSSVKPKIKDAVVVIAGPDKGRTGALLGIDGEKSIVKLSTKELKVIDLTKIAKQL